MLLQINNKEELSEMCVDRKYLTESKCDRYSPGVITFEPAKSRETIE